MEIANLPRFALARDADNVFARITAAASPFLPHEEAQLGLFSSDGRHVRRFVSTNPSAHELREEEERWLLDRPELARFCNPPAPGGEMRAWIKTPVRLGEAIVGVLVFFARSPLEYGAADLTRAQWVADVVTVLAAENAATPDELASFGRWRDASLDASEEVLREIAHVLDVREVFPRISAIINRVLPHDRLTMTFHDPAGLVGLEASSNASAPDFSK